MLVLKGSVKGKSFICCYWAGGRSKISHWLVPHPIEIQVELAARFDAKILQRGLSQGSVLTAAPRKQRNNGGTAGKKGGSN